MIVVDSSAFLAAAMPDERDPNALAIVETVQLYGAYAPPHFHIEVTNSLLTNVRRKRIDSVNFEQILCALCLLPIRVDDENVAIALQKASLMAIQYELTAYDSAYLELAQRYTLPLATFDKKLAAAAATLGLLHPAIASSGLTA